MANESSENADDNLKQPIAATQSQAHQEAAVGISAYVSPTTPSFSCTVKQRYTDFLVNEILTDGTVLHLASLTSPESGKGQKRSRDEGISENAPQSTQDSAIQANGGSEGQTNDENGSPRKKRRISEVDDTLSSGAANGSTETASIEQGKTQKERKTEIVTAFPDADRSNLRSTFGDAVASQIVDLHADTVLHPNRKPREHATVLSEPITEKSKRTEAHVTIRKIFTGRLETATLQDQPGIISIKAASTKAAQGARGQLNNDGSMQKGKLGWSDLGGEYLHFTLYKENKDTMEALHYIATQLKVRANMFQFAGTKDRRGVTVQRVAIFRVRAEQVARLNKQARGWRVGDFSYEKHGLDLGDSAGNEFLLTLRDCHFDGEEELQMPQRLEPAKDAVSKAGESFQKRGFLNYYGLQRFGTYATGTHVVGQKMLQGDLKGAIDCILTYDADLLPEKQDEKSSAKVPQDDIARADTIRKWRETGKYNDQDKSMPRRFQAESSIMQYLSKKDRKTGKLLQDQDWQGALTTIQRNLRLMYVHAYQSFVWNVVAGKRWEMHGDNIVGGDLVIIGEKDGDEQNPKDQIDDDGEPIFHPAAHDTAQDPDEAFTRARPLSKEEAVSGKYDIFDIVLPLPGFDVEYPSNAVGKYYEEFMGSKVGGQLDPHSMRRAWKDLSLSGAYRKLMARPGPGFGMEVRKYRDENEQMVETDLERLQRSGQRTDPSGVSAVQEMADGGAAESGGDKLAIVLKMQLGSSQYATMALRELTKGGAANYRPDYSAR